VLHKVFDWIPGNRSGNCLIMALDRTSTTYAECNVSCTQPKLKRTWYRQISILEVTHDLPATALGWFDSDPRGVEYVVGTTKYCPTRRNGTGLVRRRCARRNDYSDSPPDRRTVGQSNRRARRVFISEPSRRRVRRHG